MKKSVLTISEGFNTFYLQYIYNKVCDLLVNAKDIS